MEEKTNRTTEQRYTESTDAIRQSKNGTTDMCKCDPREESGKQTSFVITRTP